MSETYYELLVATSPQTYHHFLSFLLEVTPIGLEEVGEGSNKPSIIVRSEDSLDNLEWGVKEFARALSDTLGFDVIAETEIKELKNSDWVELYRKGFQPVQIGQFYVHPSWEKPKDSLISIVIEPSFAFGTGHHASTASSLLAIEKYKKSAKSVLDVGTGSGILAIGAAKLGKIVDMCDTDIVALNNAKDNFEKNGVSYRSIWEGSASRASKKYDMVIANIVADVLTFIAADLKSCTEVGGVLILSGIVKKYEKKVLSQYSSLELLDSYRDGEWLTLVLRK